MNLFYLLIMKCFPLLALFLLAPLAMQAQIMFRNDFVIGNHQRIKNKGLSFITINVRGGNGMGNTIFNRGWTGNNIVIDVEALRNPHKVYTYTELAERIYAPGPSWLPATQRAPQHLLMEPPQVLPWTYGRSGKITIPHSRFYREL